MKCRNCSRSIHRHPAGGWRHTTSGWTACQHGTRDTTVAAPPDGLASLMASPLPFDQWPETERIAALADGYIVNRAAS